VPDDASNITPFPRPASGLRIIEGLRAVRDSLQQHPQANAYGHEPLTPLAVDQDGGRVILWGERLKTYACESNAARACAALEVLVDLGLLTPRGVVRAMLKASLDPEPEPPEAA
jgi:hypothetical protein